MEKIVQKMSQIKIILFYGTCELHPFAISYEWTREAWAAYEIQNPIRHTGNVEKVQAESIHGNNCAFIAPVLDDGQQNYMELAPSSPACIGIEIQFELQFDANWALSAYSRFNSIYAYSVCVLAFITRSEVSVIAWFIYFCTVCASCVRVCVCVCSSVCNNLVDLLHTERVFV